jgi:hypothetical protein
MTDVLADLTLSRSLKAHLVDLIATPSWQLAVYTICLMWCVDQDIELEFPRAGRSRNIIMPGPSRDALSKLHTA